MRGLLELSAARVAAHTAAKRAPVFVRVFTDITAELARLRQQLADDRAAAEQAGVDLAAGAFGARATASHATATLALATSGLREILPAMRVLRDELNALEQEIG